MGSLKILEKIFMGWILSIQIGSVVHGSLPFAPSLGSGKNDFSILLGWKYTSLTGQWDIISVEEIDSPSA